MLKREFRFARRGLVVGIIALMGVIGCGEDQPPVSDSAQGDVVQTRTLAWSAVTPDGLAGPILPAFWKSFEGSKSWETLDGGRLRRRRGFVTVRKADLDRARQELSTLLGREGLSEPRVIELSPVVATITVGAARLLDEQITVGAAARLADEQAETLLKALPRIPGVTSVRRFGPEPTEFIEVDLLQLEARGLSFLDVFRRIHEHPELPLGDLEMLALISDTTVPTVRLRDVARIYRGWSHSEPSTIGVQVRGQIGLDLRKIRSHVDAIEGTTLFETDRSFATRVSIESIESSDLERVLERLQRRIHSDDPSISIVVLPDATASQQVSPESRDATQAQREGGGGFIASQVGWSRVLMATRSIDLDEGAESPTDETHTVGLRSLLERCAENFPQLRLALDDVTYVLSGPDEETVFRVQQRLAAEFPNAVRVRSEMPFDVEFDPEHALHNLDPRRIALVMNPAVLEVDPEKAVQLGLDPKLLERVLNPVGRRVVRWGGSGERRLELMTPSGSRVALDQVLRWKTTWSGFWNGRRRGFWNGKAAAILILRGPLGGPLRLTDEEIAAGVEIEGPVSTGDFDFSPDVLSGK